MTFLFSELGPSIDGVTVALNMYETLMLLLCYVAYIVFMIYDEKAKTFFLSRFRFLRDKLRPEISVKGSPETAPLPAAAIVLAVVRSNGNPPVEQNRRRDCQPE